MMVGTNQHLLAPNKRINSISHVVFGFVSSQAEEVSLCSLCLHLSPLSWSQAFAYEIVDFLPSSLLSRNFCNLEWMEIVFQAAAWLATQSEFIQSEACLYFVDHLSQQTKQAQAIVLIAVKLLLQRDSMTEHNNSLGTFVCTTCFIFKQQSTFPVFTQPHLSTRNVGRIRDSYVNLRLRLGFA